MRGILPQDVFPISQCESGIFTSVVLLSLTITVAFSVQAWMEMEYSLSNKLVCYFLTQLLSGSPDTEGKE